MACLIAPERITGGGFILRSYEPGDGPKLSEAVNASYEYLKASQRVSEKAGMLKEGVFRSHDIDPDGARRDTVCYAALKGEWKDPGP